MTDKNVLEELKEALEVEDYLQSLSEKERVEWRMFGATQKDVIRFKPENTPALEWALSLLSDAQEIRKFDEGKANQYINQAKFWISAVNGQGDRVWVDNLNRFVTIPQ